jgi:hypothetical protein
LILFFFRKSTTRSYYLMNFSQVSMRGAEIWGDVLIQLI